MIPTNQKNKKHLKLLPHEKIALELMQEQVKKPKILNSKDFKVGNIIFYSYRAKYDQNPYDANPITLILGRNRKYTYGLNINWIPPLLRQMIWKQFLNKTNQRKIEKGQDIVIPKLLVKKILRMGIPAYRMYINKRISHRGVVIPKHMYQSVISLRSEHFINISSDEAWNIAVEKMNKNKGKKKKSYPKVNTKRKAPIKSTWRNSKSMKKKRKNRKG